MTETDPRYPIGRFQRETIFDSSRRGELISIIEAAPAEARAALEGIPDEDWDLSYRDGGWTVRQVIHHLADSHLNATIRFRLALTEDTPAIKTYNEDGWAALPDVAITPPEVSLVLLEALHRRWTDLLRAMQPSDFERDFFHPEHQAAMKLADTLALYAWHGRHHVAHIRQARGRR